MKSYLSALLLALFFASSCGVSAGHGEDEWPQKSIFLRATQDGHLVTTINLYYFEESSVVSLAMSGSGDVQTTLEDGVIIEHSAGQFIEHSLDSEAAAYLKEMRIPSGEASSKNCISIKVVGDEIATSMNCSEGETEVPEVMEFVAFLDDVHTRGTIYRGDPKNVAYKPSDALRDFLQSAPK